MGIGHWARGIGNWAKGMGHRGASAVRGFPSQRVAEPVLKEGFPPLLTGVGVSPVVATGVPLRRLASSGKGKKLTIPNSQFPIPNSQFPIPNSQFPMPNAQCLLPIH